MQAEKVTHVSEINESGIAPILLEKYLKKGYVTPQKKEANNAYITPEFHFVLVLLNLNIWMHSTPITVKGKETKYIFLPLSCNTKTVVSMLKILMAVSGIVTLNC
jgi:hypothetical protein